MANERSYSVTMTGKAPLIMHWDNIEWAEKMKTWRSDPENRKFSVAGDDRSPAHAWIGCLYNDGAVVAVPSDNVRRCIMEAGARVPVPGGRSGKTFKAQTQSGMTTEELHWPLLLNGAEIPIEAIQELEDETDFNAHLAAVRRLGFDLMVKRARINAAKHIRVRPIFSRWSIHGTLLVWDEQITTRVLNDLFRIAGDMMGLGDWRPSSRTPGPFGRFDVKVAEV